MNWTKILIAGVVGGFVMNMVDWVTHGMIMAKTYEGLPGVYSQEQANPAWFFVIAVCIGIAAAILYAKTFSCWGGGLKAGCTFGFFLGLALFFGPFYDTLVIDGFPYYLAWCHGGMMMISAVVLGCVLGLIYKP